MKPRMLTVRAEQIPKCAILLEANMIKRYASTFRMVSALGKRKIVFADFF